MAHTARGAVVGLRGAVVGVRGAAVGVRGAAVGNIGIPTYVISRGAVVRQPYKYLSKPYYTSSPFYVELFLLLFLPHVPRDNKTTSKKNQPSGLVHTDLLLCI